MYVIWVYLKIQFSTDYNKFHVNITIRQAWNHTLQSLLIINYADCYSNQIIKVIISQKITSVTRGKIWYYVCKEG